MVAKANYERLEAKISPETKKLAERAALAKEMTLTDYLISLIKTDAPKTLKAQTEITLTNEQFDNFLIICNSDRKPSKQIRKAADMLDKEGF